MLFDRVVPNFFLGALFFLEVPTRSLSLSFFDPFICLMTAPRVLRDNRFNNNNNNNNKKEPGRKTRYQPDGKGPPEPDGLDHVRHDEVRAAHLSFFLEQKWRRRLGKSRSFDDVFPGSSHRFLFSHFNRINRLIVLKFCVNIGIVNICIVFCNAKVGLTAFQVQMIFFGQKSTNPCDVTEWRHSHPIEIVGC